jgi:hypothetical protein
VRRELGELSRGVRRSGAGARLLAQRPMSSLFCLYWEELVSVLRCCGELLLDPSVCICRVEAAR